tara:strand:+ start:622 stop:882 length:261 start_codon:yes stop_codon:yes gene_type:complete
MARHHTNKNGNTPFTEAEEKATDVAENADAKAVAASAYKVARKQSFSTVGEQLDQLFHDMAADKGNKTGEWYKAVAKVKSDNPKPE